MYTKEYEVFRDEDHVKIIRAGHAHPDAKVACSLQIKNGIYYYFSS